MYLFIKNIRSNPQLQVAILIFLLFCGRFYYLQGFVGHLKPTAPAPFIFLKDFILILICISVFWLKKTSEKTPRMHFFAFVLWLLSLLTILTIHFFAKNFNEWGQHYVRNVFLVFLATPSLYFWSKNKKNYLLDIFFYSGLMNTAAAILQTIFLEDTLLGGQRPLGLVGDPISLTLFMYIFLFTLFFKKLSFWQSSILYIMCGYVINISGSLSATAASTLSFIPILFFIKLPKNKMKLAITFALFLVGFFIPMKNDYNSVKHKAWVYTWGKFVGYVGTEFHPGTFSSEKNLYESMNSGRSKSIEAATEAITMNTPAEQQVSKLDRLLKLTFGDFSNPIYSRFDSTPAVLVINWGAFILILFYLSILIITLRFTWNYYKNKNTLEPDQVFALYCILTITLCGFANSILYRSPINFILLLCLIILLNAYPKTRAV